jgi:hypothetical protein
MVPGHCNEKDQRRRQQQQWQWQQWQQPPTSGMVGRTYQHANRDVLIAGMMA